MEESSDGQSVISVRQDACSRTLWVTLLLPPIVVDEADVMTEGVAASQCDPMLSPKGLGECALEIGLVLRACCCCCCC